MPRHLDGDGAADPRGVQRIDKWLWFTRLVKSRTLAAGLVEDGKVRINRGRVGKASASIKRDDVVTVTVHGRVRVLKVLEPGTWRGPPREAQTLYEDLSPPPPKTDSLTDGRQGVRERGHGRPTKLQRRAIDRLREQEGD